MHAWLALGAAHMDQGQNNGQWQQVAIHCQSKALNELNNSLRKSQTPDEVTLGTMLLLHLFEREKADAMSPSDVHIQAAYNIFVKRRSHFRPSSMVKMLLLQSLIFRIALYATFRPLSDSRISYCMLDELVDVWASSPIACGLWQHSLWAGVPPQMLNIGFKLSVLLRRAPLDVPWCRKLDALERNLNSYEQCQAWPVHAGSQLSHALSFQSKAASYLYICACHILIEKIQSLSSLPVHASPQVAPHLGFQLLKQLSSPGYTSVQIFWPAIVISLTAQTSTEQSVATTYLGRFDFRQATIAALWRMVLSAWEMSDGRMRGLDVLLESECLAEVFF